MRYASCLLALLVSVTPAACGGGADAPAEPRDGRDVIRAMARAHSGSRYRTLTFVQRTVTYGPEGAPPDTSTWYEALAPHRLRIDVAPWREGNGLLYRDGVRYTVRGGQVADSTRDTNPLAVILSDAFHDPAHRTAAVLDSLGFDLTVLRQAEWEGSPAWVVGAAAGDSTAPQFWIDRDRMLPVRIVYRLDGGPALDARIGGYGRIDGSWVESEIDIHVAGRLAQTEEYRQIRVNPELPEGIFDPRAWTIDEPYWE